MKGSIDTIAVVSDLHIGGYKGIERFDPELGDLVVERVNMLKPDLVLVPGDSTADGMPDQFEQAVQFLGRIECPRKVVTKGQHDWNRNHADCFEDFFGELPSYNEFGDLGVFTLDSADPDHTRVRDEVTALELKVMNGAKLTKKERAELEKEIGEICTGYELVKDPGEEKFAKHFDYYSNLMNIYALRIKRLQQILKADIEYGFLGRSQRKWLSEELKYTQVPIKIVMTHHSPLSRDYSDNELVDGGNLLRTCIEKGLNVNLLVVGDRHTSDAVAYNQEGRLYKPLIIFQAGSATNRQYDPNQYGVIEINREKREITLSSRLVKTDEPAKNRFWGNPYYPVTFSFNTLDN